MFTNFDEALSISMSNKEISNSSSGTNSKSKINLRDLLKVTLNELSSEIENFNKKNKPMTAVQEVITIDDTKKFINPENVTINSIRILLINKEERNKVDITYNLTTIKSIITRVNKTINRYYGKLILEFVEPNKVAYVTLELTRKKSTNTKLKEEFLPKYFSNAYMESYEIDEQVEFETYYQECMDILERGELLDEEADLDSKYGIPNKNNLVDQNNDKSPRGVLKLVKSIYGLSDEDFIDGAFMPIFTKALARGVAIIALTAGSYGASKLATRKKGTVTKKVAPIIVAALVAVSAYIVNRSMKRAMRDAQRKRLQEYYKTRLAYIDDKMEKAETDEEKHELRKLRSQIARDAEKCRLWALQSSNDR